MRRVRAAAAARNEPTTQDVADVPYVLVIVPPADRDLAAADPPPRYPPITVEIKNKAVPTVDTPRVDYPAVNTPPTDRDLAAADPPSTYPPITVEIQNGAVPTVDTAGANH